MLIKNKLSVALLCFISSTTTVAAATVRANANIHHSDRNDSTRIHLIGRNSFIVESDGEYAVIDSGEDNDAPANPLPEVILGEGWDEEFLNYMDKLNMNTENFKYYIGTHAHSDHIGSADEVIYHTAPQELITPVYSDDYMLNKKKLWDNQYVYDRMIAAATAQKVPITQTFASDPFIRYLGTTKLEIFNTVDYSSGVNDLNSTSLVIKITAANGKTACLSADMNVMLGGEAKYSQLIGKVDIGQVNHHGEHQSNSKIWMETLDATVWLAPNYTVMGGTRPIYHEASQYNSYNNMIDQMKKGHKFLSAGLAPKYGLDALVINLDENLTTNLPADFEDTFTGKNAADNMAMNFSHPMINGLPKSIPPHKVGTWKKFGSRWSMLKADNRYVKDEWIEQDGNHYYFDSKGYMKTGWFKYQGDWYFFDAKGYLVTKKWVQSIYNRKWYYLDDKGVMLVNTTTPDGYRVGKDGAWIK